MRTIQAAAATVLACLVAAVSATAAFAAEGETTFVSAPGFHPPTLLVNTTQRGQAPGYVFLSSFKSPFYADQPAVGQYGPMIVDSSGHFVWLRKLKDDVESGDFKVQKYGNKNVLTWWEGQIDQYGQMAGSYQIADDHYKVFRKINGVNGWDLSLHDLVIEKNGNALVTAYKKVPGQDLTAVGGGSSQDMWDSGVLEFSIKTGKLVREWSAMSVIPFTDSYTKTGPNPPAAFDPYHINSIEIDSDGNWLVSMRNTWTVYKVDSKTGQIIWRLGGKASDFTFGEHAQFAFQHNARWVGADRITIFDNDCCALIPQPSGPPKAADPVYEQHSRGIELKLDTNAKTATLVQDLRLYELTSGTQGNVQRLANGDTFIGWGQQPYFSEFDKSGKLLLAVRLPDPMESYRAFRFTWTGHPSGRPAVAARANGRGTRVYVSWNGATQVAAYRVWTGSSSRHLKVAAKRARRVGFETTVAVKSGAPIVKVQALDSKGRVLGTSRAVRRQVVTGHAPTPSY